MHFVASSDMVRDFNIDVKIQNAFLACICGAALLQTRRLLLKTRRLFGKFLPN